MRDEAMQPAGVRCAALLSILVAAISLAIGIGPAHAQEGASSSDAHPGFELWTVIIPEGFPRFIYTWRVKPDGTYGEDGRDAATGRPIQKTLSGRWTVDGARMVLRQDTLGFVFDGTVVGDRYAGTLYLGTRRVSRFCAARGEATPLDCEPAVVSSISDTIVMMSARRELSPSENQGGRDGSKGGL